MKNEEESKFTFDPTEFLKKTGGYPYDSALYDHLITKPLDETNLNYELRKGDNTETVILIQQIDSTDFVRSAQLAEFISSLKFKEKLEQEAEPVVFGQLLPRLSHRKQRIIDRDSLWAKNNGLRFVLGERIYSRYPDLVKLLEELKCFQNRISYQDDNEGKDTSTLLERWLLRDEQLLPPDENQLTKIRLVNRFNQIRERIGNFNELNHIDFQPIILGLSKDLMVQSGGIKLEVQNLNDPNLRLAILELLLKNELTATLFDQKKALKKLAEPPYLLLVRYLERVFLRTIFKEISTKLKRIREKDEEAVYRELIGNLDSLPHGHEYAFYQILSQNFEKPGEYIRYDNLDDFILNQKTQFLVELLAILSLETWSRGQLKDQDIDSFTPEEIKAGVGKKIPYSLSTDGSQTDYYFSENGAVVDTEEKKLLISPISNLPLSFPIRYSCLSKKANRPSVYFSFLDEDIASLEGIEVPKIGE